MKKQQFEAELRRRYDAASLFLDTWTNIFEAIEGSDSEVTGISIYRRAEDVLLVARQGADDQQMVLFASADNLVDSLFALDTQLGLGAWKPDRKNGPSKASSKK